MSLINFSQKNKFFRKIIYKVGKARAKDMVKVIEPFLNKKDKILDVGSGTCNICEILRKKGHNVTPLDIQNLSFIDDIKPILYDGNKMPFDDDKFDIALILTVLHHTPEPERILREAMRISFKIIIIEDIYTNVIHKYLTYFFDSLLNLEFIGHPHTNQNDKQWKATFNKLGLRLINTKYRRTLLVFKQAIYYLEK